MTTCNLTTHIDKDTFCADVMEGLSNNPKRLDSKYFYDAKGDKLFQKIMACEEYYLTNCEMEIMKEQSAAILEYGLNTNRPLSVVELGPGDAAKSIHLLEKLSQKQKDIEYQPIDISENIIQYLEKFIPQKIDNTLVMGRVGEYLKELSTLKQNNHTTKLVLFLGSSIGNMGYNNGLKFLKEVRRHLNPGDLFLVGFDLMKDPQIILNAYNDKAGYTKAFNLNLLHRINRELKADFKPCQFAHFPTYDRNTGICKSHLISLTSQEVTLRDIVFHFAQVEMMEMEISQKFHPAGIKELAQQSGFKIKANFYDKKKWFVDALWEAQ